MRSLTRGMNELNWNVSYLIPKEILLPIIFAVCIIGVFGVNSRLFDVWTVLFFGIVGYLMRKIEFPSVPIILDFVLGPILEETCGEDSCFRMGAFSRL